jgi:hypothetical protein
MTSALFTVPAALHVAALHWCRRPDLDAFDWLIVGVAICAAVVLSLVAGGISHARAFLSIGLITCCIWTFGGLAFGSESGMVFTYFVLAVVVFVAQLNLVPIALLAATRAARPVLSETRRRTVTRMLTAHIASVALLDLVPFVFLLVPYGTRAPIAVIWLALCAIAAGVFAGIAARSMPHAFGPTADDGPATSLEAASPQPGAADRGPETDRNDSGRPPGGAP